MDAGRPLWGHEGDRLEARHRRQKRKLGERTRAEPGWDHRDEEETGSDRRRSGNKKTGLGTEWFGELAGRWHRGTWV